MRSFLIYSHNSTVCVCTIGDCDCDDEDGGVNRARRSKNWLSRLVCASCKNQMPSTDRPADGGPSDWERVVDFRRCVLEANQQLWEDCLLSENCSHWTLLVPEEDQPNRGDIDALARYGTNAEEELDDLRQFLRLVAE